jgi:outer membrane protein OmpA-like peptidoglycan-associated protein
MSSQVLKFTSRFFAFAFLVVLSVALVAQDSAKPAVKAPAQDSASKWDIFAGYSYLAPKSTVNIPVTSTTTEPADYTAVNVGVIGSVAGYFSRYIGAEAVGDVHSPDENSIRKADFSGGSLGLIARYPTAEITPFVHALVGGERVGSYLQRDKWGIALTAGGGLDYATPLFDHHLAIRLFQVDYQYMHDNFGPGIGGGRANINAVRLSAGIVYRIGSFTPPPPVTLACSASPASVFPGEPVTVTGTADALNPKLNTVYSWTGTGVTGSGTTASVATASLTPGPYTVKGEVKEGKAGKEGLKAGEVADCSASFTVKAFEPPTIRCSANPSTINPGETSIITCVGVSPQNRPLTYGFSSDAGTLSASGATATLNSTGAPAGAVSITGKVSDDQGQFATANTSVTITAPPPPPEPSPEVKRLEARLALHSVFFPTAQPRIKNPEGGLVASQQTTLTTLATDFKSYLEFKPNAHITLTGHADVRGSKEYNQALSERRVARTKSFLIEKGVPEASIETRGLGSDEQLTAGQVKELVEQNSDLSAADRQKAIRNLKVIVLAQNRRVDVTLSTTGEESVRQFPLNAADALTLLEEKNVTHHKKSHAAK